MLPILIVLFTAFFTSAIFIYSGPAVPGSRATVAGGERGKVLGVSEAVADYRLAGFDGTVRAFLPSAETVSAPRRCEEAGDFSAPDCVNAAVLDADSGEIIFSRGESVPVPIASITKLVAALVFLDFNPGWDTVYKISAADRVEGGREYLFDGERVTVKDLFHLSLVGSANTATKAMVGSTGLSASEFVATMNGKAAELGLADTHFFDFIGLSDANVSTAGDVARLALAALRAEEIGEATLIKKYEFTTLDGRKKTAYNTDILLDIFPQNGIRILGGKTGYTSSAGYCFAGRFVNADGREIVSAILGGETMNSRFKYTKDLVEWIYDNYVWE